MAEYMENLVVPVKNIDQDKNKLWCKRSALKQCIGLFLVQCFFVLVFFFGCSTFAYAIQITAWDPTTPVVLITATEGRTGLSSSDAEINLFFTIQFNIPSDHVVHTDDRIDPEGSDDRFSSTFDSSKIEVSNGKISGFRSLDPEFGHRFAAFFTPEEPGLSVIIVPKASFSVQYAYRAPGMNIAFPVQKNMVASTFYFN